MRIRITMQCPKCGNEIANDSQFCEFCGAQIKKTISDGRVDVRWALLPAMITTAVAMYFSLTVYWLYKWGIPSYSLLPMSLAIVLFGATVWCRIKKVVPTSFVLIMAVGLIVNSCMLYSAYKFNCITHSAEKISYADDEENSVGSGSLKLMTYYDIEDEDAMLDKCSEVISYELRKQGKKYVEIEVDYYADIEYFPDCMWEEPTVAGIIFRRRGRCGA